MVARSVHQCIGKMAGMDAPALLDEANACHDQDPLRCAELLRGINAHALEPKQWPLLAFLFNHVLGEKLGLWQEARERNAALAGLAGDSQPVLRHAAVAATLAGDGAAAAAMCKALAIAAGSSPVQVSELVQLAATVFRLLSLPAAPAAAQTQAALAVLSAAHWLVKSELDVAAAAQCNNLASHLVDRPLADLAHPELRASLEHAAVCAQRLWQRAGNWVNHERACYLRALAASAQGDAAAALAHACDGLALLDANDLDNAETVDRAFLGLEESFALHRLNRADEAAASRSKVDALATAFGDAGLRSWFKDRVARNANLLEVQLAFQKI